MYAWCYYICTHFSKKIRLRLSYICAHKSITFVLSFGVTFAPIFSQLFLVQLLVFYKVLALLPRFTDLEVEKLTQDLKVKIWFQILTFYDT